MLKKFNTLRFKFPIITFFTYMLLINIILIACYFRFNNTMIYTYTRTGEAVLNLASQCINIDNIPDYLSGDYDHDEYMRTAKELEKFMDDKEIYYLYVYQIHTYDNKATVIFDMDTDHMKADELGDTYTLEKDIISNKEKLLKGENIKPLIDKTEWGYLLTYSMPLVDSNGVTQGCLFIDFNLNNVISQNIQFILKLFLIVFILMLIILFSACYFVDKRITKPIEDMYLCLSSFNYMNDDDIKHNIQKLQELNIKTNPEIQSLYTTIISTLWHSYEFQQDLKITSNQLSTVSEKVYVDVLTGCNNKYAYEEKLDDLQDKLNKGEISYFSVIMADINNLKYVNDTFGHEEGDSYIIGCFNVIADIFKRENIYRIGGDEFVIILDENNYFKRVDWLNEAKHIFSSYNEQRTISPFKRYSMSLGMADYDNSIKNILEVVKKADNEMYKNKQEFKAKYGSYR